MNRITKMAVAIALVMALFVNTAVNAQGKDIEGHWSEATVRKLQADGLISGYADGTFRPNQPITRAEFVAALNRILGLKDSSNMNFKDVSPNDWFAKELAIAVHYGYIKGYPDGTFRPNRPVSRFEVAIMISRANRLSENYEASSEDLNVFHDHASIPNWVKADLALIVKSKIMQVISVSSVGKTRSRERKQLSPWIKRRTSKHMS